jgi:serine/threonine-protein kinase
VLTPNYAAPEQFLGGTITTSTDVYSLGVLLYELLSGTRPYCWHGLPIPTILDSWERERPTPPSATFADPAPAGTSILCADTRAEYRSSTGGALCRRLSGDLDNIVLMALRFEPHRRYGSVPALVEDLQRFLDGRVVRARPSTWSYRLGKFVRRNALVVSQTALVFALVLLFAVRTLLESRRVAHERNVAEEQRRAAVRERATTEAVTDLLLEAYRVTDPYRGQGQTLRAEEVLARGAQLAESTLTEAPHVRAQVEHTLGRLYLNLGLFERAEGHLQRALALGDAVYGVDSVETAAVRATVADVFLSRNDFESAERAIRQAIQVLRDRGSDQEPTLGSYRRLLARVLTERGRFTDAELLARQALVSHRRGGDRLEAEVALDLNTLLEVQVWRGDHEAALASGNEAVEKSRRAFPAGSVAQAESLAGRGISLWNLRRFDEAMQDMNEAMALAEGSLGDQHPSVAAISGNLGLFHLSQGDLAAAEPLLRRAIATFRANFDRPHSALLRSQSNLARVLMQSGRARAAVALLEECVVGYRELYGDDHPLEAEALQHLGSTYYIDGQLDQAASALAQALLIRQRSGIADRTTEGANRVLLARVERERGQPLSARRHLGAALEIFARLEGDLGAWLAAIGEMRLAEVFVDLGRIDEAEALIERSMAAFSKVDDDPDHQAKRTECRGILGRILAARGRLFEAEAELAGSLEELRAASWTSAEQQAEGARRLVEFYEAQGRSSEASAYRSLSVRRPSFE